ncbi:YcfL family protein [bacterium]|nr:YcfL family protein [bacterium]
MTAKKWGRSFAIASLLLIAVLAIACGRSKAPDMARWDEEAIYAAKFPVNILDPDLRNKVAADMYDAERLDDGRILVRANLRNSTKEPLHVEARAVFKDKTGMSTGDETEWKPLFFAPQQIQTYIAESQSTEATRYTIEVRRP